MRATPLTTTGPQNLHPARAPGRPVAQTKWTKHGGLVSGFEVDTLRNKSGDVTGIQIRKPGTSGNADTMRIMLKSGSQPERITYYNDVGGGQPIDPERGVAGNDPSQTHIPLSYRGPWKGLPKWWTGG